MRIEHSDAIILEAVVGTQGTVPRVLAKHPNKHHGARS